ncbi:MAG: hypothetical protein E7215_17105 [Clostridium sulfidigenes]|jgi:hypothetical protein|uniref:Uncharacterized protein n=1 Tax=Clostridium sulfidigenes TaxID=318464 RepID=A0A927ZLW1_9CLOT|nr:hypothetical protein [Clostridium sulfidigenes]
MQNNWVNFDNNSFYIKRKNEVTIALQITAGIVDDRTAIATLPSGYMPLKAVTVFLVNNGNGIYYGHTLQIDASGNIRVNANVAFVPGVTYQGQLTFYAP